MAQVQALPTCPLTFPQQRALAARIRAIRTPEQQAAFEATLTPEMCKQLKFMWGVWCRGPDTFKLHNPQHELLLQYQRWAHWLVLAGRGFGKSRLGAEWVRYQVESGNMRRIALVARTPADARAVMIEGKSGLLNVCPPWFKPVYEPSKRKLTWPNGAEAYIYSSEKPDQLRGPEHDGYWADELAAWRFLDECWDNLMFGLRLNPMDGRARGVITTTPRPLAMIKEMVEQALEEQNQGEVYLVQGSTLENAGILPRARVENMLKKYQGTRLGDQELYAKILSDSPGALWVRDDIQTIHKIKEDLTRVVIGVDPQKSSQGTRGVGAGAVQETTSKDKSKPNCSTGIIGAGRDGYGRGYVLEDFTCDGKPEVWAAEACRAYDMLKADCIVAEANAGGDMVESVILAKDPTKPVKLVHATRGKLTRAEPVSMLYKKRGIVHYGHWPELEDQMCNWDPNRSASPDRVDALVWAFTDLLLGADNGSGDDEDREVRSISHRRW